MDIVILRQNKCEIELKIKGETHTLLNIIKSELLKDKRVDIAYYDLKSLLNSVSKEPILYLKTYNEQPLKVLKETIDKIINMCNDFSLSFKNSVQDYKK